MREEAHAQMFLPKELRRLNSTYQKRNAPFLTISKNSSNLEAMEAAIILASVKSFDLPTLKRTRSLTTGDQTLQKSLGSSMATSRFCRTVDHVDGVILSLNGILNRSRKSFNFGEFLFQLTNLNLSTPHLERLRLTTILTIWRSPQTSQR